MYFQFQAEIRSGMQPFDTHLLELAVDRFNRMPIQGHLDVIKEARVGGHIHAPSWDEPDTGVGEEARFISGAVGGFVAQQAGPWRQHNGQCMHWR
jgi:hypothetical protein